MLCQYAAIVTLDELSLIGDFGFSWNSINFKKWAEKYNTRKHEVHGAKIEEKYDNFA